MTQYRGHDQYSNLTTEEREEGRVLVSGGRAESSQLDTAVGEKSAFHISAVNAVFIFRF